MGMGEVDVRHRIAKRAAQEIQDGMIVNLGIGIPTLAAEYIPEHLNVWLHAENGIMGAGSSPQIGEEDPHLCNAGGFPITLNKGGSYMDSTTAFGIIRKGLLDMTILGALEVSSQGDLANWIVPGKRVPGMGGAIELAQKAKKVIVVMSHLDKYGQSKVKSTCTLPLTAKACVNLIITDMAVIEVESNILTLREVMPPFQPEDVIRSTEAPLIVSPDVKLVV
ncbi:3-oxoacid CoA-transferase subunit B [Bacillus sp. NPDC077027]|uniref:3-oxoacid CoA-transferase subunit B n=1 Tax=Bacillus sp. NPDC077027 TaxID=3390548 RepID=UPI003CFFBFA2